MINKKNLLIIYLIFFTACFNNITVSKESEKKFNIGKYGSNFLAVYNCIEISFFSIIYSSFKFNQYTCSSESSTSRFFKLETNSSIVLVPINAKEGNFRWIGHAPAIFWLSTQKYRNPPNQRAL